MTTLAQATFPQPLKAYIVALVVIFAAAVGPITIRQAQVEGVPSLYFIAARFTLASLIMAGVVFVSWK